MENRLTDAIERFGEEVSDLVQTWAGIAGLVYDTLAVIVRPGKGGYRAMFRQIVSQILFTGVEALWLVGVIAIVTGVTVVLQATDNMPRFGVGDYFGKILIVVVVRELGPFFAGLIVSARSGSAFAAYVGNMRMSREIAALQVMGIEPVSFLIVPAFLGMVISAICLNVYFAVIAIGGGLLVAGVTADLPFIISLSKVTQALTFLDVASSMIKGTFFGVTVATVSGYYGMAVRSVREVPQAALKSVVYSIAVMIIMNVALTIFLGLVNA